MSDREALRRLAMRAQELDYCGADYENATAPPIVLALLDETGTRRARTDRGTQRHGLRRWRAGCRCPICCVARDHDAAMARVRKEGA